MSAGDRQWHVEGVGAALGATVIRSRPGHIPWTVVRMWARWHHLSDSDTELLEACTVRMDGIYIDWWIKRNKIKPDV